MHHQTFLARRAHAAQMFASAAACAGAAAGLSREATRQGIIRTLSDTPGGHPPTIAAQIADSMVGFVYASVNDEAFKPVMAARAEALGARLRAYRELCAGYPLSAAP